MKRLRSGFTLVEVSLFLAITAAIFVGVAVGTQNSIFQQRYNDSIQSFAEFLRSIYSQVLNVQNENLGRSDKAIYGKIVVFGVDNNSGENRIVSYNVIGNINSGVESGSMLELMASLGITTKDGDNSVGFVEDFQPKWGSQIQTTEGWENGRYKVFSGALLILRHPNSGTVNTYFTKKDLGIENPLDGFKKENDAYKGLEFDKSDIDFCINPNGAGKTNLRRDVRIVKNARNSSGIEVIGDENDENDNGNRCRQ